MIVILTRNWDTILEFGMNLEFQIPNQKVKRNDTMNEWTMNDDWVNEWMNNNDEETREINGIRTEPVSFFL